MAAVRIAFGLRAPGSITNRLEMYGRGMQAAVIDEMGKSKERVYATAYANTPVGKTGNMQRKLRRESSEDGLGYFVGWAASDFPAGKGVQTKMYTYTWPGGTINIPSPFYPGFVIFGTRFRAGRDPVTPALLEERPTLLANLTRRFQLGR